MNASELPPPTILFVCAANMIRSPMAAGFFLASLNHELKGVLSCQVQSAGIFADTGRPPMLEAVRVMKRRRIDISRHRSRPLTASMLEMNPLVLVMEMRQKTALQTLYPTSQERIFLLSEMAGETTDVLDPVGGTLIDFEHAAIEIDRLLTGGMARITDLLRNSQTSIGN